MHTVRDNKRLICSDCKRGVHYRCTRLPVYQLECFVSKKHRKFTCAKCVVLTKEFVEEMADYDPDQSFGVDALTQQLQDISLENQKTRSINKILRERHKKLGSTIKNDERLMKEKDAITDLQAEIKKCEKRIKEQNEREKKLNTEVLALRKNVKDLEKKNLGSTILKNLEEKFKDFKDSIFQQVRQNSEHIEIKINETNERIRTYADVTGTDNRRESIKSNDQDFHQVMERRNKKLIEEREQLNRAPNIIVHGVQEIDGHRKDEEKKHAKEFMTVLFTKIGVDVEQKLAVRLGEKKFDKTRPIKVVLSSEEEKYKVFSCLKYLKGYEEYKNISLTHDHTVAERKLIKAKSDEAKAINQTLPDDCDYVMQVRGNPKNGLILIRKYRKKNTACPTTQ